MKTVRSKKGLIMESKKLVNLFNGERDEGGPNSFESTKIRPVFSGENRQVEERGGKGRGAVGETCLLEEAVGDVTCKGVGFGGEERAKKKGKRGFWR